MAQSYGPQSRRRQSENRRMAELKTKPGTADPLAFLAAIADRSRRQDCIDLCRLMTAAVGEEPVLWGGSIVGFGSLRYRTASGRTGTWFRAGFASRKRALTVYLMLDLDRQADLLAALGKHKRGRGCLYVQRLADIDLRVLRKLIAVSLGQDRHGTCGTSL